MSKKNEILNFFKKPYGEYGIETIGTYYLYSEKIENEAKYKIYFANLNKRIEGNQEPFFELSLRETGIFIPSDSDLSNEAMVKKVLPNSQEHFDIGLKIFNNESEAKKAIENLGGSFNIKEILEID
ncbi:MULTISPECIES: hypothetical protein [Staphylococcus]|uniref:hypothetical protein n=1 Tax=Staphylococcus TaxID=1279 RepID=UPI0015E60B93|nr:MULTISPECIES: hypothetical protein [Staphylococcus]MBA1354613.1 hypothetical protein [Staphylococcus cohnii]MBA1392255.1 hypothetical protein [Staphylococcus cohnii]